MAIQQDKRLLLGIIVSGLIARLIYTLSVDSILHPDEVIQYLEQAHRSAYGYGLIPWEYRHGIRSWLLPWLLALPLKALQLARLDQPEIYIPSIKAIMCFLSCSLIYTSYVITESCWSKRAGITAAAVTASWIELIIYAPRATPEVIASYSFCIALAIFITAKNSINHFWAGLAVALCLCLRYQYIAPLMVMVVLLGPRLLSRSALYFTAGFLTAFTSIATIDYFYWGDALLPYINNFRYNAILGISSSFGVQGHFFYLKYLLLTSSLLTVYALIVRAGLINPFWRFAGIADKETTPDQRGRTTKITAVLSIVLVTLVSHSAVLHKEYRFVVLSIPLICILTAGLSDSSQWKKLFLTTRLGTKARSIPQQIIALGIAVILMKSSGALSAMSAMYSHLLGTSDSLKATAILRREPEIKAILRLDTTRGFSGGFYYLHRPARIYGITDVMAIEPKDYLLYFSHIVQKASAPTPPGFKILHRVGHTLVILARKPDQDKGIKPLEGGREIINPKIDGIYSPVKPRRG